ncbi:putative mg2+ transporter protein [Cladophialophora carrionii]|uniref:Putative mg2+ transporter protein n=1 Tax=Cladophialophora carrionii TaxID=86049 RepID=A0A1C1CSQ1_9EURO|nr:putative mg2+ transporter protein [Cladophialophora carrionii]
MIPLVRVAFLLGAASFVAARPLVEHRAVTQLDQAATEEAQQRDDTATRAFSSVPIKTSDGQCLFVDPLSGDFRENLTPIQVGACDGSQAQEWDVITAGKHNNVAGSALIVSGLTQACFNFDPRRAAGNQVLLFSCGGRADGGKYIHAPARGAGPLAFTPENAPGSCFTVKGAVIDIAACDSADPNQSFTFGDSVSPVSAPPATTAEIASEAAGVATVTVSPTAAESATSSALATAIITTSPPPPDAVAAPTTATAASASAGIISVSRAGSVLNPSDAAEANPRDDTATRAFSAVSIKSSSSGQCLFIDPTAGDFRENLIPIVLQPCDGSANQQWDFLTAGVHNDEPGSALIVSSVTQGCLNFDPRREAGDTVIMFSCGGRADGSGLVTDSQLFTFTDGGETSLRLQPGNGNGQVCLVANADGRLDQAPCSDDASQVFTIG